MGKITEELASEQEARDVAEAARESDWVEPSFLRELFLGRFRLDLIHPFPPENEAEAENARPFMEKLRAVLGLGGLRRDRPRRPHSRRGRAEVPRHRRVRDQDSARVRRPRSLAGELHPRDRDGHVEGRLAHRAALRAPVDRAAAAAQALRHRRAEEAVLPAPRQGRDLGVRAHGDRRGQRSGEHAHEREAQRGWHALHPQRHEAVVHQRHARRADAW